MLDFVQFINNLSFQHTHMRKHVASIEKVNETTSHVSYRIV